MKIEVFAVLKDFYDKQFTIGEALKDIHELKRYLIKQKPEAEGILRACRFAVNDELVGSHYNLKTDDRISVIPPSSGG
jgi:molybdopterin synthase sulfur carrier subunit